MKKIYLNAANYVLLLLLFLPLASQAQFTPIPGHVYTITNRVSGACMEVGGSDRYAPDHCVNGWSYWGGANQQWEFKDAGNGQYKIQNRNSRQFLRKFRSQANSPQLNTAAQTFENNSGGTEDYLQRWSIVTSSTGGYKLMNMNSAGFGQTFLIESNGLSCGGSTGRFYTTYDLPGEYQDFIFLDVSVYTGGVFRIINSNSGKALSAGEDNNVTQTTMYYLAGQEWTFSQYNADGYLAIINRSTGRVLEMGGSGDARQPGRNANVWDGYGNEWQQWRLVDPTSNALLTVQQVFTTAGQRCKLLNRYSGLILEIGGGGDLTREGLPANQWYNVPNVPTQEWYINIDSNYRGVATAAGTAASEPTASTLTLYPNPASTTLQLTLPGNSEALQVTVTDAHGRTVQMLHHHGKVDVSNLASGLYIVSAADGQKTFRQKFIKE